jgi:hypothetical protein
VDSLFQIKEEVEEEDDDVEKCGHGEVCGISMPPA